MTKSVFSPLSISFDYIVDMCQWTFKKSCAFFLMCSYELALVFMDGDVFYNY